MRNFYITGSVLFALVLAIGVATAQTSTPSSEPQAAPSSPPSQASPSSEPQQPAPSNTPSQASPQAQPSHSGDASAGRSQTQNDPDNPLNLTDEQKEKLRPIVADENQQLEALRSDTSMTQEQKMQKANQIRETASPKIKAILTPEQLQKLAELQDRAKQQRQSAPSSDSQSPQR